MKVAITISGEPRFCKEFDLFLERLKGFEQIDWYFYLWKENFEHSFYKFDLIAPSWRNIDYKWALEKIVNNLPSGHRLIKLHLADQKNFLSPNNSEDRVNVYNVWKMYQSIKESNQLIENNMQYDLVIRTRPDVMLEQELDLSKLYQDLNSNPNRIVVPNNHWYGNPAINDWIAISSPNNMRIYSNVIDHIDSYISKRIKFHPETLLAHHLKVNNLEVVKGNFGAGLRLLGKSIPNVTYHPDFGRWS